MKKTISLLTAVLLCSLSFTSCNSNDSAEVSESTTGAITSEFGSQGDVKTLEAKDYYVVNVSVNPEVELYVSPTTNEVLYANYLNDDALKLANDQNLSLVNAEYDKAVEDFIKACADDSYLNDSNNGINIEVKSKSADDVLVPITYGEKMTDVSENVDNYVDFEVVTHMPCGCCDATGICDLCHGEKAIGCDGCGGVNSTVTCSDCDGTGMCPCTACHGACGCTACNLTGTQTCDACGGSGCWRCNNTGIMECKTCHGHSACSQCDGTGKEHCNPCASTGKIVCTRCDGDGTMTCVRCDGDGLCPSCHGKKEL